MFISKAAINIVPARKSSRFRITVPKLLQLPGMHDELTLEQNLSDAFYDGKIKRKHGKDCFVYELTRKEIVKYCIADKNFDYEKLERFRKRKIIFNTRSVIETIDEKIEETTPNGKYKPTNRFKDSEYSAGIERALEELKPYREPRFKEFSEPEDDFLIEAPYVEKPILKPEVEEKNPCENRI